MFLQSNLDKLKARKKELKLTNQKLSEQSGVPLGTINKIFSGATLYPRRETVEALESTMDALVKAMELDYYKIHDYGADVSIIREPSSYALPRPEDTRLTIEDYYTLPQEPRAELIDGEIHYMSAPSANHQFVLSELFALLREYLRKNNSKCRAVFAPYDVQLDMDEFTILQPDLMILCDKDKYENGIRYHGAPEFIIEIVSPSNPKHDYTVKLYKYRNAGVREYWIVDPAKMRVLVYVFSEDEIPIIYSFQDKVKSSLFPGLEIDFSEVEKIML